MSLDPETVQWLVPSILSGGALGGVLVKLMSRNVDTATASHLAAQSTASEVQVIRDVLTEVRTNASDKDAKLKALELRVEKLEERERHMLTRAAVHEAWDQMAFAMLLEKDPGHPPPPPLVEVEE